jgi:hypothetical protein
MPPANCLKFGAVALVQTRPGASVQARLVMIEADPYTDCACATDDGKLIAATAATTHAML